MKAPSKGDFQPKTRHFVITGAPSVHDAHDMVEEHHGDIVESRLFPSPAGEAVYGAIELEPKAATMPKAAKTPKPQSPK